MLLAFGVLCALFEAQKSGHGQVVDAAMINGSAARVLKRQILRLSRVSIRRQPLKDGALAPMKSNPLKKQV